MKLATTKTRIMTFNAHCLDTRITEAVQPRNPFLKVAIKPRRGHPDGSAIRRYIVAIESTADVHVKVTRRKVGTTVK